MSYNIGQFREPNLRPYIKTLTTGDVENFSIDNPLSVSVTFQNKYCELTGENIMESSKCYYLCFGIKQKASSTQTFILKIKNSQLEQDNEQLVDRYTVDRGVGIVYFETIISPNSTYDQIIWELQRTASDYQLINPDGTFGRNMEIEIQEYDQIIDIIPKLQNLHTDLNQLAKIGVQGPPGLLMCINKEQIRIGRSGVYELNNGIKIFSLGFIPKGSYFLVDFEY